MLGILLRSQSIQTELFFRFIPDPQNSRYFFLSFQIVVSGQNDGWRRSRSHDRQARLGHDPVGGLTKTQRLREHIPLKMFYFGHWHQKGGGAAQILVTFSPTLFLVYLFTNANVLNLKKSCTCCPNWEFRRCLKESTFLGRGMWCTRSNLAVTPFTCLIETEVLLNVA